MLSPQDIKGVMAMMPAFATEDAGDIRATDTVDVNNLTHGVERLVQDGVDVIATTGSFGECYNLLWDEFRTLAYAAADVVKKRVPLFIGVTSTNPREVVQKMKVVQDTGADGVLLGVPYYQTQSQEYISRFYGEIADLFPDLTVMIYHNPENHKTVIPLGAFHKIVEHRNIIGMKDSHRDTRAFIRLQEILQGRISVFVNQIQLVPYASLGAAGCWSTDASMGPWPVLHLRDLAFQGKDKEALKVIADIMGIGEARFVMHRGGVVGYEGGGEGGAGKTAHALAGYCNPGPTRTPVVEFSEKALENARKKAEHWKGLCEKYRPLVEAQRAAARP